MREADIQRFVSKIEVTETCWLWRGGRYTQRESLPYGRFKLGRKMENAHRIAYVIFVGQIPDKMHVLHRCDNPPCVNPAHLFAGTQAENNRDMTAKGRHWSPPPTRFNAKITEAQEAEIRSLRASGESVRFLADRYGLSAASITRIAGAPEHKCDDPIRTKNAFACRICGRFLPGRTGETRVP
jgi:hypothetical protein